MKWRLRGCPVCGGDLYLEPEREDWLTCLMCARSYRVPHPRLRFDRARVRKEVAGENDRCREQPWLPECGQAA